MPALTTAEGYGPPADRPANLVQAYPVRMEE
jgi:hypothetical protein